MVGIAENTDPSSYTQVCFMEAVSVTGEETWSRDLRSVPVQGPKTGSRERTHLVLNCHSVGITLGLENPIKQIPSQKSGGVLLLPIFRHNNYMHVKRSVSTDILKLIYQADWGKTHHLFHEAGRRR